MLNNFVFVFINLSIDIYMLVRLRKTLNEKMEGMKKMNLIKQCSELLRKQRESNQKTAQKELELQAAMNNAIRMVVLNSTLNIIFKLPFAFGPFVNVIATFYYKSDSYRNHNFGYHIFMHKIKINGIYYLIPDFGEWLLTVLFSVQLFIYVRFDNKIKMGFYRFLDIVKEKKTKLFEKIL